MAANPADPDLQFADEAESSLLKSGRRVPDLDPACIRAEELVLLPLLDYVGEEGVIWEDIDGVQPGHRKVVGT